MNRVVSTVLVVLILAFAGYLVYINQFARKPQTQPIPTLQPTKVMEVSPTSSATDSSMMADALTVTLNEQNQSGETGTATLKETNGKVTVTLTMKGAPSGAQPSHIHVGSCKNLGAVKYPLNPVVNGKSETTVNVTLAQLKTSLPFAINVHKSADEAQVYVACGDLLFK